MLKKILNEPSEMQSKPVPLPVPGEVIGIGMEGESGRKPDVFSILRFEQEAEVAAFMEGSLFDENVEVVGERPESAVEEPVGGFGEGQAVADEAGAALAEAADVGGVEDGGAVLGDHAVAGEGAGEVVGGQDLEGEAGFTLPGGLRCAGGRDR